MAADDPLDDFELGSHSGGGFTREVHRSGEGPNCIVMAEIPGITPAVADFARRVRTLGCSVTLPVLFGEPGRSISPSYIARSITKACVASEFAAFATNSTAPISTWLRSLANAEHERCGGPGVGAVGMCFTGGFAALEDLLGENFIGIEIDSSKNNPHGNRRLAHSVLTEDLVDEPGHPTRVALDQVLEFLADRLLPDAG